MVELKGALKPRATAGASSLQCKRRDGAFWWLVTENWGVRPRCLHPALGADRALRVHGNSEEGHPGPPLSGEQKVQEPGGETLG